MFEGIEILEQRDCQLNFDQAIEKKKVDYEPKIVRYYGGKGDVQKAKSGDYEGRRWKSMLGI